MVFGFTWPAPRLYQNSTRGEVGFRIFYNEQPTKLKNLASNFTAIYGRVVVHYVCESAYINENVVCARQYACEHCTIAHAIGFKVFVSHFSTGSPLKSLYLSITI